MIKKIVDISKPSYLRMKLDQLIIEQNKVVAGKIPVEDIGILILEHPAIVVTQSVVVACQKNNIALVFCDTHHLPCAIVLSITNANSLHSKVLQKQIDVTQVRRKQIWQQVVKQKILQQSHTLSLFNKEHKDIKRLAAKVKSGDKEKHESQAAQKYWRLLFGDKFRRNPDLEGINALLNYGYAIVRAMVARAIVGGGLHPSLGIHHHNQYNGLNLADDLMEPFRPWVDQLVFQLSKQEKFKIGKDTKKIFLALPGKQVIYKKKSMPLMVSCHYLIADLKRTFQEKTELQFPILEKQLLC